MFRIKNLAGEVVEVQTKDGDDIWVLKTEYIRLYAPKLRLYSSLLLMDESEEMPDDRLLSDCSRDLFVFVQPDYIDDECLLVAAVPNPSPPYRRGLEVSYKPGSVTVDSCGLKPSNFYFAHSTKPLEDGSYFVAKAFYGAVGMFIGEARIFFSDTLLVKYTANEVVVLDERDRMRRYPLSGDGSCIITIEIQNPGYNSNQMVVLEQASRHKVNKLESLL